MTTHANLVDLDDIDDNKMALWQVNQFDTVEGSAKKYHFTKVRDFQESQDGSIVTQAVCPSGTSVATVSTADRISVWKLFDQRKVDFGQV